MPLFVYKLGQQCRDVLVTDKFLYVTDIDGKSLSVVSCQLSESRIVGDTVSNFFRCFLGYPRINMYYESYYFLEGCVVMKIY